MENWQQSALVTSSIPMEAKQAFCTLFFAAKHGSNDLRRAYNASLYVYNASLYTYNALM
jgi:hypothetical protein